MSKEVNASPWQLVAVSHWEMAAGFVFEVSIQVVN